ncbi:MAG: D-amino-acid transaminase [Rhodospirillales bacterium]|nr:MAG: D-amino-acid transaminase [Rhodospirillales bacterium]
MSRVAYVNGRYVPLDRPSVHVEDRGYQFADGVYEVIAIEAGAPVDEALHLDRLDYSLAELAIAWPMSRAALKVVMREVVRRNRITARGIVYLQVTRGVAPRNHAFPADVPPSLVLTARPLPAIDAAVVRAGVRVVTVPDLRWKRADIKSVSLLPNVLGKEAAVRAGAYEAWMVDETGRVTEGTASNAWIVTAAGDLVTRQADHAILNGITRRMVHAIAAEHGIRPVERPFTLEEARTAAEAFLTSTTSLVRPVVRIDDAVINDGRIGPLTERLLTFYLEHVRSAPPAPRPARTTDVGAAT